MSAWIRRLCNAAGAPARWRAALGLAAAAAGPTAALDIRVGQAWSCDGPESGRIDYVIGALDRAGPERDVLVAHLSAVQYGPDGEEIVRVGHLPFQANLLTCRGQRYVGEGQALPPAFAEGHARWRETIAGGGGGWFTLPIDEVMAMAREARR